MRPDTSVLITGAGGFIGGWIAESYHLNGMPNVRAGIRRWSSAARIARYPITIVPCDVMNREQLEGAVSGTDVVVHCSVGSRDVTVEGTRNLLDASLRHGVKRVVNLSTMDIYGGAEGSVTEATPFRYTGSEYGDSKIDAEKVCQEYIARGLPVVTLRPTIVYGPYNKLWIAKFAERLRSGRWGLFSEWGDGTCNPVYVMDLVRAITLAIESDSAPGEAFNVNGGEIVSWNEYFRRLNAALGLPPLRIISPSGSRRMARVTDPLRNIARAALRGYKNQLTWAYQHSAPLKRLMRAGETMLKNTPSSAELEHFGTQVVVSIEKAERLLGYHPTVGLDEGLRMSARWLMHEVPDFPPRTNLNN